SRPYALKYNDKEHRYEPDLEGVIRALKRFAAGSFPVRFMGFPSYTYFLLRQMEERGIRLKLKKGSRIMLGGGWKQFYKEQVEKEELYRLAKKVLDVDEENIIEFFGAVEHPILYCDCVRHHFHVPVYSRVLIRDVDTLEPVPMGQVGLVNLLTPMVKATPILSVMTDDLGVLHPGSECGCGLDSPYLEIIGRVGLKDIKTCAAGAAELLQKM
ncbi:MAG: acyl-protein synthetase, partial [Acetatifactor sp.]|nr:acyl-protein synthetase [Acetatifactor sp.]